jgi:hypothetical protein
MDSLPSTAFLGRIYRISAPAYSRIYIGSTRGTIAARLGVHRCLMRRWESGLTNFTSSFEVLAQEGATIDLIEESEFDDSRAMHLREAYWIEQLVCCVNRYTPGRTTEESTAISRRARVECPSCGLSVRRLSLRNHQLSRACMMAAFNSPRGASGEQETQCPPHSIPPRLRSRSPQCPRAVRSRAPSSSMATSTSSPSAVEATS